MSTTISESAPLLTFINVFRVEPHNQDKVIELLTAATDQVMRGLPGFISANLHRSLDGKHVVNYVQWESQAHFEAIFTNERATRHMQAVRPYLVSSERNLYQVVSTHPYAAEGSCPA
jgi:quinol monooxygenase YgiN